jgi:hypothetical protein
MSSIRTFSRKLFSWSSLLLCLSFGTIERVVAATPETAPAELKETISQIEAAANRRNIQEVLSFYSPDFSNSDGMKLSSLEKSLTQLWKSYSTVKYSTEIKSWEQKDSQLVAETLTTIRGTQRSRVRSVNLESKIRSRQYFQNKKLVSQEILAETTKITSGDTPPNVDLNNLPDRVKVGEKFDFDVIISDPIGDDLLLGAAMEERVTIDRYLNPSQLELEVLPAGGIFKQVKAPLLPDRRWLSAIIVRGDGIVQITHRVTVESK